MSRVSSLRPVRVVRSVRSIRRAAAVAGAAGLIALSLAGPAAARPDPGTGGSHEGSALSSVSTGADEEPIRQVLRIDDDALEYLQLGAGVAAGLALAGAGGLIVSRRHGHHLRGVHLVS